MNSIVRWTKKIAPLGVLHPSQGEMALPLAVTG
jgi:hypothetical protein